MNLVQGTTRELACLALGHADAGAPACPASDDQLMRDLVAEVRRLRQRAGEEPDRDAQRTALDDVLTRCLDEWETGPQLAQIMLDRLAADGWQLVPADQ